MKEAVPRGYWKDICNVILEIEFIKGEYGFDRIPTHSELIEEGHARLSAAISMNGGFEFFRELYGEDQLKKPSGTWKNLSFVVQKIKAIIEEHDLDSFPSANQLTKLGYGSLRSSIVKYHGGFTELRKIFRDPLKTVPFGMWKNLDFALEQAIKVKEAQGVSNLPCAKELRELGHKTLDSSITLYHGGYHEFRKHLGEKPKERRKNTWSSLEYAIGQASDFMTKHGFSVLPSQKIISSLDSALVAGIQKNGGIQKFRELLGGKNKKVIYGLWKNLDYALEQAKQYLDEQSVERLPGTTKLSKDGYSSLSQAIVRYHGGMRNFRLLVGDQSKKLENGAWKNTEFSIKQGLEIMEKHDFDELPTQKQLQKLGYASFVTGITRHQGGLVRFSQMLREYQGIPTEGEKLEKILTRYVEEVA